MHKYILISILVLSLLVPISASALLGAPCPPGFIGFEPDCVPETPPTPDPIIVIPGITGSWNWDVLFRDSAPTLENWKFPPFDPYGPLIEKLKDNGYEEGKTLFVAFYDWRQPNILAARDYLKPIIDKAKLESGKPKVDLIAHSMGGILARSYIQNEHYFEDDVDQLFTLGTPHYGSSDVYAPWEGGHIPSNWDLIQQTVLKVYLFFKDRAVLDRARYNSFHTSILSLRDLLPTYDYLKDKNSETMKQTSTLQEQNTTLNTFNATIEELNALVGSVTTIAGNDQATVAEIPVVDRDAGDEPLWADGKPDPLDPVRDHSNGDNRVLLSSAHIDSILDQVTLANARHGDLPSKSAPELFTRLSLPPLTEELALAPEPTEVLSFWFASPVAPIITDPNNQQVSTNFNSIPGAIYFGEDDPNGMKMILIPNPLEGEYKIDLIGTANGHYDFASTFFKQDEPEAIQTFSDDITQGEQISYTAHLNTEEENPLETELVDTEPPVITITSPLDNSTHRNDLMLPVEYTVTDQSTINNEQSTFDQNPVSNNQVIDLSLFPVGTHTLVVSATDEPGNEGHATSTFLTFVTHQSLKNNINHYFSLGLIKNKGVAAGLIALVEAHRHARNQKAKNAMVKSFEILVNTFLKTKLLTPQAATLLLSQIRWKYKNQ